MAVIAGVGAREYYRKNGYELRDTYMLKELVPPSPPWAEASLLGIPLPEKIRVKQVSLLSAGKLLLAPLPSPPTPRKKQSRQTRRNKRQGQARGPTSGCADEPGQFELRTNSREGETALTESSEAAAVETANHVGRWSKENVDSVGFDRANRQRWLKRIRSEWQDAGDVHVVDVAEALDRARLCLSQTGDPVYGTADTTQRSTSRNFTDPDSFRDFQASYGKILSEVEELCEPGVEVSCSVLRQETHQRVTAPSSSGSLSHVVEKVQATWNVWKQSCQDRFLGSKQMRLSTAAWVSIGLAVMAGCSIAVLRRRRR